MRNVVRMLHVCLRDHKVVRHIFGAIYVNKQGNIMRVKTIMNSLQSKMKILLVLGVGLASQSAAAIPIFDFEITGNTVYKPFSISNLSTDGEFINSISVDISGLGFIFDTIDSDGTTRYSKDFTPSNGTGELTGVLPSSGAADSSTFLQVIFNDFNPGEKFLFDLDVDTVRDNRSPVYGNQLIGSRVTVGYSNGVILSGLLGGIAGDLTGSKLSLIGDDVTSAINSPTTLSLFALIPLMLLVKRSKKRQVAS